MPKKGFTKQKIKTTRSEIKTLSNILKKINPKILLTIAMLLVSTPVIVNGAFSVFSNRVDTNVVYGIALTSSTSGSVITLTAKITTLGGTPLPNANIAFFRCASDNTRIGVNATALSIVVTDAMGTAIFNDATTIQGLYHHIAMYSAL
jgi:hypothetical protein